MRSYGAIVRCALDRACRLKAIVVPSGRWPLVIAVAAASFVTTLGPVPPVRAANPPDPVARLQFIIHKIHIIDDEDLLCGVTPTDGCDRSAADAERRVDYTATYAFYYGAAQ